MHDNTKPALPDFSTFLLIRALLLLAVKSLPFYYHSVYYVPVCVGDVRIAYDYDLCMAACVRSLRFLLSRLSGIRIFAQ